MTREAGKGSTPRPFSIPHDEYVNRWEMIFGNKQEPKKEVDFIRESHYTVIKNTDIKVLSLFERDVLNNILDKISRHRRDIGKSPLSCVVVESDWPEYEKVWEMIEERVKNET